MRQLILEETENSEDDADHERVFWNGGTLWGSKNFRCASVQRVEGEVRMAVSIPSNAIITQAWQSA
jgi:hypothetical protein